MAEGWARKLCLLVGQLKNAGIMVAPYRFSKTKTIQLFILVMT
ncbi:hypothetical protein [Lysinibacillus sp. fls2-241-R2A-57]|nr:hypothetical protein [Lysinibacillus sp. fls2-241-R2A-57]